MRNIKKVVSNLLELEYISDKKILKNKFNQAWKLYQRLSSESESNKSVARQFLNKSEFRKYYFDPEFKVGFFRGNNADVGLILHTENPSKTIFYNPGFFKDYKDTTYIPRGGIVIEYNFRNDLYKSLINRYRSGKFIFDYSKHFPDIYNHLPQLKVTILDKMNGYYYNSYDCNNSCSIPMYYKVLSRPILIGDEKNQAIKLVEKGFSQNYLSPCPQSFNTKEFCLVSILPIFKKILVYYKTDIVGFIIGSNAKYIKNIINYDVLIKKYHDYNQIFFIYDAVIKHEFRGKNILRILLCELNKLFPSSVKVMFSFDCSENINKALPLLTQKSLRIKEKLNNIESQLYVMLQI